MKKVYKQQKEDERAECIEKDVEPSEDLKDAYEAISEIFRQLHPIKKL